MTLHDRHWIYETELFRCTMFMLAFRYGNKTSFGVDERFAVQHNCCLVVLALSIVWCLVKSVMRSIRTFIPKQQFVIKALHLTNTVQFSLLVTTAVDLTACITTLCRSRSVLLTFCLSSKPEIIHIFCKFGK